MANSTFRDLRWELQRLEELGQLAHVRTPVSRHFELSAVAKLMAHGPAVMFHDVQGSDIPVVLGTSNSMEKIAALLQTDKDNVVHRLREAIDNPLPPVHVDDAPCQEVVIQEENIDLLKVLPVQTHYERDMGPYITAGVVMVKDQATGVRNCSFHRFHVSGPGEANINMLHRHLWRLYQAAEAQDRGLEVAIVLGVPTAIRLASASWGVAMPMDKDELAVAGALAGQPVPLVRAKTVDVDVPAFAEIVIEGEIPPHIRKPEGPMMELTGNYGDIWDHPIFRVRAVTMRRKPIYQDLLSFTPEHLHMLGLPYEPMVYKAVASVIPDVRAVHVTAGGCGKFHAIVSIKKRLIGDGKDAILAAFTAVRDIKQVIVVDDDVDVFDHADVEWAVATRFQADKDLVVISGARGNDLDPSQSVRTVTAKMGIDATKDITRADRFDKGIIPGMDKIKLEDYLEGAQRP